MISNCGKDERGKYSGGKAGDQTGKEYALIPWYNRPWTVVLRPVNPKVGKELAEVAKAAAKNNKIGYDQLQRLTYYNKLKNFKWHPERINVPVETDCSASTCANIIAVGHRLGIDKLKKLPNYLTTSSLKSALKSRGFVALTDPKYLKSDDYLLPGDILLKEGSHVAINVSKGSKAA